MKTQTKNWKLGTTIAEVYGTYHRYANSPTDRCALHQGSRPERWYVSVNGSVTDSREWLNEEEAQRWYDNCPESLQHGPRPE